MPDVNNPAPDPSAAPKVPEVQPTEVNLSQFSPEERQKWRETGKIPEQPQKQDSAPADPPKAEKSEADEAKPAAEPETAETSQDKPKKGKATAEERIRQLLAEKKDLEERLRQRAPAPQPASKSEPEAKAQEPEKYKPLNQDEWMKANPNGTWEEFEAAKMDHHYQWRRNQEIQAEAARQRLAQYEASVNDARERYPDAEDKIRPTLQTIAEDQTISPVVKAMIGDSEVAPHLLYVLATSNKLNDFLSTARTNPGKALRQLRDIERDIEAELAKPARDTEADADEPEKEKPEDKPEKSEPAQKASPAPPETRAPKPPAEIGGRGTAPSDTARDAAQRGDFRTARTEWNRRAQDGRLR